MYNSREIIISVGLPKLPFSISVTIASAADLVFV